MGRESESYPSESTTTGISKRNSRNQVGGGGGGVACSGKSCRSCTGRVIADCVAVCCCPCAVVNFFTLTFLKLPWMMGKRCLGNVSKKKKEKKEKLKLKLDEEEKNVISRKEKGENGASGRVRAIGDQDEEEEEEGGKQKYMSARFEAERVWLELYRVDNLGFGRVSFTGIQSLE